MWGDFEAMRLLNGEPLYNYRLILGPSSMYLEVGSCTYVQFCVLSLLGEECGSILAPVVCCAAPIVVEGPLRGWRDWRWKRKLFVSRWEGAEMENAVLKSREMAMPFIELQGSTKVIPIEMASSTHLFLIVQVSLWETITIQQNGRLDHFSAHEFASFHHYFTNTLCNVPCTLFHKYIFGNDFAYKSWI